ncbi:hypothetical protein [Streptomyces sp. NPDC050485]
MGSYGQLRTVTKVPGEDALWLSTTNGDNNGTGGPGLGEIFRVLIK